MWTQGEEAVEEFVVDFFPCLENPLRFTPRGTVRDQSRIENRMNKSKQNKSVQREEKMKPRTDDKIKMTQSSSRS